MTQYLVSVYLSYIQSLCRTGGEQIMHGTLILHPYVCMFYEAVYAIYLKLFSFFFFLWMCDRVYVRPFPCVHPVRGRVSVHGYCSLERVCMSTILDRACEGCLSMCVLLSVQSSRRQQGAPFQFTHQPRRWGVKARGIAVGDFTFEGRDYQSGDPCVEVMREGDCRGTVWGSWDCWGTGER